MFNGQPCHALLLWGRWRRWIEHAKYRGNFKFRGCYFTHEGRLLLREDRDEDSPYASDDYSEGEEPTNKPDLQVQSGDDDNPADGDGAEASEEGPPPARRKLIFPFIYYFYRANVSQKLKLNSPA